MYSTYDNFDFSKCKHTHDFLLCPEINPLHPRSTRPICEIQLLQEPKVVPANCEIMYVKIATSIFHKLQYKNAWIYVTKGDTLFITCDNDKESSSHLLEGVGIIKLNNTCKGYASRDVLIPGQLESNRDYQDFIPKSIIQPEPQYDFNGIAEDRHIRTSKMSDLDYIATSRKEIVLRQQQEEKFIQFNEKQSSHSYLLYVTLSISSFATLFFIIAFVQKLIEDVRNKTEVVHYDSILLEQPYDGPTAPQKGLDTITEVYEQSQERQELPIYPELRNTK